MSCAGKKSSTSKQNTKPPKAAGQSSSKSALDDRKNNYAPSDQVKPLKTDYIEISNSAGKSIAKNRFVILTSSVLILYDEISSDKSRANFNFQK